MIGVLCNFIAPIQSERDGSITDLKLDKTQSQKIEQLTVELEGVNPNLYPLRVNPSLLQEAWQLLYSTAREICSLAKLPLGLKVSKVYQVINIADNTFFNLA